MQMSCLLGLDILVLYISCIEEVGRKNKNHLVEGYCFSGSYDSYMSYSAFWGNWGLVIIYKLEILTIMLSVEFWIFSNYPMILNFCQEFYHMKENQDWICVGEEY